MKDPKRRERFELWTLAYGIGFLVLTSIGLYGIYPPLMLLFLGGWCGWMAHESLKVVNGIE